MFALPDAWEVKAKPTLYHPPQTVTPYSTYTWSRVILLLTLRKDAPSYAEHKFCPHTQAPSSGSPPPDCMSGSSSPNPEHSVFLNWRRARICGKEASWLPVIPFLSVALQFLNIFTSFQTCHNLGNTPVRFIRFLAKMVSKSLWFLSVRVFGSSDMTETPQQARQCVGLRGSPITGPHHFPDGTVHRLHPLPFSMEG